MKLKYFVFKEEVQKHRVLIKHVSTELMIVDPLTKGLPSKVFTGHVKNMDIMIVDPLTKGLPSKVFTGHVKNMDIMCPSEG